MQKSVIIRLSVQNSFGFCDAQWKKALVSHDDSRSTKLNVCFENLFWLVSSLWQLPQIRRKITLLLHKKVYMQWFWFDFKPMYTSFQCGSFIIHEFSCIMLNWSFCFMNTAFSLDWLKPLYLHSIKCFYLQTTIISIIENALIITYNKLRYLIIQGTIFYLFFLNCSSLHERYKFVALKIFKSQLVPVSYCCTWAILFFSKRLYINSYSKIKACC